jgi:amidase
MRWSGIPHGEYRFAVSSEMELRMTSRDLCFRGARELAGMIQRREVSCREVMEAHLAQIAVVNPVVNAIVSKLDDEAALAMAEKADAATERGPLHGLPLAVKDLDDAFGFPTSLGSPIYKDTYPAADSLMVERLRGAGALVIGKTNVPEFGLGSHSFNPVFGVTKNPYDQTKSAGGSSGGAGVSLATRMLPIADGSDMGGSLRNPGNFNNIVGFRTSPGLVPVYPSGTPGFGLSVKGPMARTVADTAFMLSTMAGFDPRDPYSLSVDPARFAQPLDRDVKGLRVAWSPDLGGLPLDPRVRSTLNAARQTFVDLGCEVVDIAPPLGGADDIFVTLRAFLSATTHEANLKNHRELMKPEAVWNAESGLTLGALDVGKALVKQTELYQRFRTFMNDFDFVLCAVNQVPPFPIEWRYPEEIDGMAMENYIAWMKSAYRITVTKSPAISVPAGFTSDGLPVGIQIVGRFHDDFGVLQFAHAFEQATQHWQVIPEIAAV